MIKNQEFRGLRLRRSGCWLLALWSLCLIVLLAVAGRLQPDPRGYGTHQQLGLPPCSFRMIFGVPCPSCGMTTSISYFVRGQFVRSARSNAAGLALGVLLTAQIPWCWLSCYKKRLIGLNRPEVAVIAILAVVGGIGLIQWIGRLVW